MTIENIGLMRGNINVVHVQSRYTQKVGHPPVRPNKIFGMVFSKLQIFFSNLSALLFYRIQLQT